MTHEFTDYFSKTIFIFVTFKKFGQDYRKKLCECLTNSFKTVFVNLKNVNESEKAH
jgi:hypothetical protein